MTALIAGQHSTDFRDAVMPRDESLIGQEEVLPNLIDRFDK